MPISINMLSLLLLPLPCSPLSMTPAGCKFICCLSSLSSPLPTCVPPSEDREWGRVTCSSDHCLVHSVHYDKYSVPHGMHHTEHGEVSHDQDDPCPAKQVPHKTYSAHDQPLEVKLAITVNSISDIRLDESSFTAALKVKMEWRDPHLDACSFHHNEGHMDVATRMMMNGNMEEWRGSCDHGEVEQDLC